MNTDTQVSEKNREWLREVETTATNLDVSNAGFNPELRVLTQSISKINEDVGVLAILGGGPPEPEFQIVIDTIIQDFGILLPLVRTIYEARKDACFNTNNVLKHGHCHARTWHEIVLKNAEEFIEGSRLIHSRNACRILHDSQYESGKLKIHLELEFEQASKAASPDAGWSGWHPPGDWWDKFPKSSSWCRSQMETWLTQRTMQRKGKRGDIRFRLSFLKELDIEPPS